MFAFGCRRILCAVVVLVVGGIAFPVPAQGSPEDNPAIEQYADPFGPLPTGERPRSFHPLSDDFAVPPPELLRQLARIDETDRAPLAALVSQVATARERVRAVSHAQGSPPRRESGSDAVTAFADSLLDPGGSGGWLLGAAVALGATAALGAHRARRR